MNLALRDLALLLAPEMGAAPLYVVALAPSESLRGFCSRRVEPAFRQQLADAGEWRGPGTLLALTEDYPEATYGVLLHELAHALPFTAPSAVEDYTPDDVARAERLLDALVGLPDEPPRLCPWHGPGFVRTCCHLQHRAAVAGLEIPFPEILQGWRYRLPPLVVFARALGDEPVRMAAATFTEILATPAPSTFTSLFGV